LVGIRLIINPEKLPEKQKSFYNEAYNTWEPSYHGTQIKNLDSIIENGLMCPG